MWLTGSYNPRTKDIFWTKPDTRTEKKTDMVIPVHRVTSTQSNIDMVIPVHRVTSTQSNIDMVIPVHRVRNKVGWV